MNSKQLINRKQAVLIFPFGKLCNNDHLLNHHSFIDHLLTRISPFQIGFDYNTSPKNYMSPFYIHTGSLLVHQRPSTLLKSRGRDPFIWLFLATIGGFILKFLTVQLHCHHSPQEAGSSERSPQSSSKSHVQVLGIQRPLAHWCWFGGQVRAGTETERQPSMLGPCPNSKQRASTLFLMRGYLQVYTIQYRPCVSYLSRWCWTRPHCCRSRYLRHRASAWGCSGCCGT